ncbi:carbohydrate ABC transporter permease [Bacillus suaedaesalsae]|uniref:Sugar ABC transporter permease n=1 Tax=Bacillus suaedaesalsae TaxID=2810349 RepID=A0ABS2DG43_9BACI|nr:sugar ABC transporter permease [Bacillus suaedaesalsae]MBM6616511.1 sugar ABC transporter permease [Bacillus suaedaesalsae]
MQQKMGFSGWLYILPTLLLIGIFSLWPVVQSITYSFFDYRLNDQQKAGLYLNERFNTDLFNETALYVGLFLDEELVNITDSDDQANVQKMIEQVNNVAANYKEQNGVITISEEEKEDINKLYKDSKALYEKLASTYTLTHEENLPLLIDDFNNSVISSNWIGLKAYKTVLGDERIRIALVNTVIFTVFSVALELVLGLGLAMVLNKAIFGQGLVRTTSLVPWAIPTAVAALMWSYLYDGSSGIVAHFFEIIGIVDQSQDLLLSASGAMMATILADVWKTTPYMALLLLAGLQNIPSSLYEAASIDGATKVQSFFRVTLPLLKTSILVALLFRTLDAFRVFDLIYVLTGGGPGGSTETMSIYAYKTMFGQTNFGYGSVVVMLMFVCVAFIAIVFVRLLGTNLLDRS